MAPIIILIFIIFMILFPFLSIYWWKKHNHLKSEYKYLSLKENDYKERESIFSKKNDSLTENNNILTREIRSLKIRETENIISAENKINSLKSEIEKRDRILLKKDDEIFRVRGILGVEQEKREKERKLYHNSQSEKLQVNNQGISIRNNSRILLSDQELLNMKEWFVDWRVSNSIHELVVKNISYGNVDYIIKCNSSNKGGINEKMQCCTITIGGVSFSYQSPISGFLVHNNIEYLKMGDVILYVDPNLIGTIEEESEKEKLKNRILEKKKRRALEKEVLQELIDSGEILPNSMREPIPRDVVDSIYVRDKGKCVYCGSTEKIHIDHIIPFSKGGASNIENLQLLCQKCNLEKSNKIG